jgi:anaerobic magnesium-protoporphyrin IX monomethyl ester cyclase
MKTILLINPQNSDQIRSPGYFLVPLSLLYLAGSVRSVATPHVLDLNVVKREFFKKHPDGRFSFIEVVESEILRLKPDYVGITCLFSEQFGMVRQIADAAKRVHPEAVTVLGGMHPTIFHRDILSHLASVDAVVIGEGEVTLPRMVSLPREQWGDIEGFAFKNAQGEVVVNNQIPFVKELDTLAPPAYDLFNFADYKLDSSGWYNPKKFDIGTSVPILTSRSCPYKCSFCGMNLVMGTSFRARSAESVCQEIEYLYHEHGTRYFNIMDDNFTLDKKRIKQICQFIIDKKLDLSFDMPNGIMTTTLDDDVIDALAEAGFAYCFLAIESGSDFMRNKVMHKQLSLETIFRVVKSFRRHPQIHLAAFFLMGMPEETHETLEETYRLIEQLDIDSFKMSVATPFPGTKLFEQCQRDNLFLVNKTKLDSLWCDTNWYQRILNVDPPYFFKPYQMEIEELDQYTERFEALRHEKHLAASRAGRQTLSVTQAIAEYRKHHPGAP